MEKTNSAKRSLVTEAEVPFGDKTLSVKLGKPNHISIRTPLPAMFTNEATGYIELLAGYDLIEVKVFADSLIAIANKIKSLVSSHETLAHVLGEAEDELNKVRASKVAGAFAFSKIPLPATDPR